MILISHSDAETQSFYFLLNSVPPCLCGKK